MSDIKNKVAESSLIQIDLESFLPNLEWKGVDIAHFLDQGMILREKEFRQEMASWDINEFEQKGVFIYCSTEAIFPDWVYLLLCNKLLQVTSQIFIGNEIAAKSQLLQEILNQFDYRIYKDKNLIIKGCSSQVMHPSHLICFFKNCQPLANSIMFGEACSALPVYKKSK